MDPDDPPLGLVSPVVVGGKSLSPEQKNGRSDFAYTEGKILALPPGHNSGQRDYSDERSGFSYVLEKLTGWFVVVVVFPPSGDVSLVFLLLPL